MGQQFYPRMFNHFLKINENSLQKSPHFLDTTGSLYTLSHRECGQFHPYVHENFEKFKIISIPTGSWIRSRRRPHQLPVGVEIILNFSKFSWTGMELSTLSMGQSIAPTLHAIKGCIRLSNLPVCLTTLGIACMNLKLKLSYMKLVIYGKVFRTMHPQWCLRNIPHLCDPPRQPRGNNPEQPGIFE